MKRKTAGLTLIAVTLIYIATAFIIPFPHDFITYFIALALPGGLSLDNAITAVVIEWSVGLVVLILGILLYFSAGNELIIRRKK